MSMMFAERSAYIAGNVRPEVKDAIQRLAAQQGLSVSAFVNELAERAVEGYIVEPLPNEVDEPLPFDSVETK
jgi:hypothetical protein